MTIPKATSVTMPNTASSYDGVSALCSLKEGRA